MVAQLSLNRHRAVIVRCIGVAKVMGITPGQASFPADPLDETLNSPLTVWPLQVLFRVQKQAIDPAPTANHEAFLTQRGNTSTQVGQQYVVKLDETLLTMPG